MTIIVAFILDAFVFRMNYSRKNREPLEKPEGGMDLIRFQMVCLVGAEVETWRRERINGILEPPLLTQFRVCLHAGGGLFSVTCCEAATNLFFSLLPLDAIVDENGIVFEVEVSRDEALASLEFYKHICPGPSSISSLQGVLQAMDRGGVR